jgi:CubicO group peptidase (beta-lactamase class C family)
MRGAVSCASVVASAVILVLAVQPRAAQTRAQTVEALVRSRYAAGQFHGGILVADGTETVYEGAVGLADRERQVPNRVSSQFGLYSLSKPFTAILVLQLVADGALDLQDTIGTHLPSFGSGAARRITVHQLLSHTSGLPDYLLTIPGYLDCEPPGLSRDAALRVVAGMPLEFEPGSAFAYSNTGYVVLGEIIERVVGEPYAQVLAERIANPLGMSRTRWMARPSGPDLARRYLPAGGAAPTETYFAGDAGIVSTLADMRRFAAALGSSSLLPARLWDLVFAVHGRPENASRAHPVHEFPYGYGFSLAELPVSPGVTSRATLHGGMDCGGSAWLARFLDADRTVLVWNNQGGIPPGLPGLIEALAGEAGKPAGAGSAQAPRLYSSHGALGR